MTLFSILTIPLIGAAVLIAACNQNGKPGGQTKAAALKATASPAPSSPDGKALCAAHKAPENLCFICDASLRDPKRLWCKEHIRYEDRCFICHPEAQDQSRLYCKEHGLYEDECFLCHPELGLSSGASRAGGAAVSVSTQMCKEHNLPEEECGICHSDLLGSLKPGEGLKIRFESARSAEKAGVTTSAPDSSFVNGGMSFPARTAFNDNASAIVVARYAGILTSVRADLGTVVGKGQLLATISSPELAQLMAEFRSTENEFRVKETDYLREKELYEKNVASRQEFDNAAALFNRARNMSEALRQRLTNAGIAADALSGLLDQASVSSEFAVRAPVSGTITHRSAAVGQSVNPETPVMTIVDLSTVWIHVSVPSSVGANMVSGDLLKIAFDGSRVHPATVNWVSPEVDLNSGMVQVRAELKNPGGAIKSGMFCRAFPEVATGGRAFAVPSDALASIDGNDVVFTKVDSDLYEVRRVSLGGIVDGRAIVSEGLTPADMVVVGGTFVVKSEFLKSRLGAGCVDD